MTEAPLTLTKQKSTLVNHLPGPFFLLYQETGKPCSPSETFPVKQSRCFCDDKMDETVVRVDGVRDDDGAEAEVESSDRVP